MALSLVPMTELDAVNLMLESIGEAPVNTLTNNGFDEAYIARGMLHRASRNVQSKGLHCNSETDYPLTPDGSGYLIVPTNVLDIDAVYTSDDVVQRGNRLYNRTDHTYEFTQVMKVDIVFFLAFEDLPEVVREYIAIMAGRRFQANAVGSKVLVEFTAADEMIARAEFLRKEMNNADTNLLEGPAVYPGLRRSI